MNDIENAFKYFGDLGLAEVTGDELNPNIADSDGLVSYVVASSNPPPQKMKKLYKEIKPVMEGLTNVVVSAVLKAAGTDDKKKHDPAIWKGPMQAMVKAFCAGFSEETQHYDREVVGISVATEFISILLAAAVSEGAALAGLTEFLQSQGETMRIEASSGGEGYLYASVSIAHEIFEASDGTWIYVPKFKSYFTQFTKETWEITSACASANRFKFNFDLEVMTGAFMVDSWQSSKSFKQQVKDFIERFQKINIKDSTNYFDSIFESTPE